MGSNTKEFKIDYISCMAYASFGIPYRMDHMVLMKSLFNIALKYLDICLLYTSDAADE